MSRASTHVLEDDAFCTTYDLSEGQEKGEPLRINGAILLLPKYTSEEEKGLALFATTVAVDLEFGILIEKAKIPDTVQLGQDLAARAHAEFRTAGFDLLASTTRWNASNPTPITGDSRAARVLRRMRGFRFER